MDRTFPQLSDDNVVSIILLHVKKCQTHSTLQSNHVGYYTRLSSIQQIVEHNAIVTSACTWHFMRMCASIQLSVIPCVCDGSP